MGGRCIVSSIAYPYSSRLFRRNLDRSTNQKFGEEFKRCVSKVVGCVERMSDAGFKDSELSDILQEGQDDYEDGLVDEEEPSQLNRREIYLRIAQYIELVNLYTQVNFGIVNNEASQKSELFITVT